MKRISLQNFRKFKKLENLEFSPITIFVGENNSGKSTVVKSILSLKALSTESLEFGGFSDEQIDTKDFRHPKMYFNKSYYAHIGSFYRALYNKADNDIITFEYETKEAIVRLEVKGNKEDKERTYGEIININITNKRLNVIYIFNFIENFVRIFFNSKRNTSYFEELDDDERREFANRVQPYFNEMKDDEILTMSLSNLLDEVKRTSQYSFSSMPLLITYMSWVNNAIRSNLGEKLAQRSLIGAKMKVKVEGLNSRFYNIQNKYSNLLTGRNVVYNSDYLLGRIEYIYAHAATQNVVYNAKDKGDYLVRTIHEFAELHIPYDDKNKVYHFITTWMKKFNVGIGYALKPFGGEALTVQIKQEDGTEVNLADKGMGAIQMMVLLFRLAIYINNKKRVLSSNTIIIEEAEQNLHPRLQSNLADLFLYLFNEHGFNFIIETHSEYFVRKTQLLVAKNYKENNNWSNPFKVYYFHNNDGPYDTMYQKNGRFIKPFEPGFFDVSTDLALDLLDLEEE